MLLPYSSQRADGSIRLIARIIAGVGVGLSTVAVPILQSETLPSHNRGALLVIQSGLIIIGVAIASWLCLATLFAESSLQWRFPVGHFPSRSSRQTQTDPAPDRMPNHLLPLRSDVLPFPS